jgi:phytoene dehydrogenase-like protein
MDSFDYIIVGSGINSLTCAALLAKAGNSVCVLERNDYLGGCIRTQEVTAPGFKHDVLSGFHPLFVTSPAYGELAQDLAAHGLEYVNTDSPTGVVFPDNRFFIMKSSRSENIEAMEKLHKGDGDRYKQTMEEMEFDAELVFGLLGNEPWTFSTVKLLFSQLRKRGLKGLLSFLSTALGSSRDWLNDHFQSPLIHGLLAPWILHTGLGPDSSFSGAMNRLITFTLEQAGMPIVKGGSSRLVDAFEGLIRSCGGQFFTDTQVNRILVRGAQAYGVSTESGREFYARKAVICNVTPTQLYLQLLGSEFVSAQITQQARQYKYGRADMQIHIAMSELPTWIDSRLNDVAMLHLTNGTDAVSKAVNEAERGLLPESASIVVAQPCALDATRAPEGQWILWIQLQELPSLIKGDAAGVLEIPDDGRWNEAIKNQYADRIIDRIAVHIPNLKTSLIKRCVLSPADLASMNVNLVGGDPYSGHCGINQFFLWRPLKGLKNHSTPVKKLYHIGASTHPGPGLAGTSGYMVAKHLI